MGAVSAAPKTPIDSCSSAHRHLAGRLELGQAGYSGTPLPKKLGIKPECRVCFPGTPDGFLETLGELPEAVEVRARVRGPLDVIVLFTRRRADLERRLDPLRRAIRPNGGLWIAWPKRSSGVETDLTDAHVREIGLAAGLVDNKVCAIDGTWSGLHFVYRLVDR